MHSHSIDAFVASRVLENGFQLKEALLYPDYSVFDDDRDRYMRSLKVRLKSELEEMDTIELHRRAQVARVWVEYVALRSNPPRKNVRWIEPIELIFPFVAWQHHTGLIFAHSSDLDVSAFADEVEMLKDRMSIQIQRGLTRRDAFRSIWSFVILDRTCELRLNRVPISFKRKSRKDLQKKDQNEGGLRQEKLLKDCVTDLAVEKLEPAFGRESETKQLASFLSNQFSSHVLAVGPSGSGKTALLHHIANNKNKYELSEREFWETRGSQLIAGMSGFGEWQERVGRLLEVASRERAVLSLGSLIELTQVGRSEASSQGIADFFVSDVYSGEFVFYAECTEGEYAILEREHPQLIGVFEPFKINAPDREALFDIVKSWLDSQKLPVGYSFDRPVILEAIRLHERFAPYSGMPGRVLRFLQQVISKSLRLQKEITRASIAEDFAAEVGLPNFIVRDDIAFEVAQAKQWFESQVMGQELAIDCVLEALVKVKAQLNRVGRPISSFLFMGPTGVGKTELAKALARFFFKDESRMIRIDMSEYANPLSIARLIGLSGEHEGVLTSRVREQPFSVVLLDEFEKAHPDFFDMLLQVLGDGRLTDSAGRIADFTNTIVIMTSNLGADSLDKKIGGFRINADGASDRKQHFSSEAERFLRPEIFNRIDKIVPFGALEQKYVRDIVSKEWKLVMNRMGWKKRKIQFELPPTFLDWLVENGYSEKYGTRYLKRTLEQNLLIPFAKAMNQRSSDMPLDCKIEITGGQVQLIVKEDKNTQSPFQKTYDITISKIQELRRKSQNLLNHHCFRSLQNELFHLRYLKRLKQQGRDFPEERLAELKRLESFQSLEQRIFEYDKSVREVELELLCEECSAEERLPNVDKWEKSLYCNLSDIEGTRYPQPDSVLLSLFSGDEVAMKFLLELYVEVFDRMSVVYSAYPCVWKKNDESGDYHLAKSKKIEPLEYLIEGWAEKNRLGGFVLFVQHPNVWPMFRDEGGLHCLSIKGDKHYAEVTVKSGSIQQYSIPESLEKVLSRNRFHQNRKSSRDYDLDERKVQCRLKNGNKDQLRWKGSNVSYVVEKWIQDCYRDRLEGYCS